MAIPPAYILHVWHLELQRIDHYNRYKSEQGRWQWNTTFTSAVLRYRASRVFPRDNWNKEVFVNLKVVRKHSYISLYITEWEGYLFLLFLRETELFFFFSFSESGQVQKNEQIQLCVYNFIYILYVILEFYFSTLPSSGKYSVLLHPRQTLPTSSPVLWWRNPVLIEIMPVCTLWAVLPPDSKLRWKLQVLL